MNKVASQLSSSFDVQAIRSQFPILDQQVNDGPLVYLDNAATSQKPAVVIDSICDYYRGYNSNVHRGAHTLADKATSVFEDARKTVATFINSPNPNQVLWTRGTTEAINLVAWSWGNANLKPGDKILVSALEHHSNIVPWQMVAATTGATVIAIPVTPRGDIDFEKFHSLLDQRVKMVAVSHVSNALGTINPIDAITREAHKAGAVVMIDGAQAVAHMPVDVQLLDCDFYAFSGHKMYGPTGIGVLWGKQDLLEAMAPWQGGGEMIETVSFEQTTYQGLPYKFEAGTPNIAGAIGLGAAVTFLNGLDREAVALHENRLLQHAIKRGAACPRLVQVGQSASAASIFSFNIEGIAASDIGELLDQQGIAVRVGNHCAQPLMTEFGISGTVRGSFALYNTIDEVDHLFDGIERAIRMISPE